MRNRSLLHRSKLHQFARWLQINGYILEATKGDYEALRFKAGSGKPMAILYYRNSGDHLTINLSAIPVVRRFIKDN